MNQATSELLNKAYRLEGLITCARLAEDNDNFPALRKTGTGLAEVLAVMAELAADISGEIERALTWRGGDDLETGGGGKKGQIDEVVA